MKFRLDAIQGRVTRHGECTILSSGGKNKKDNEKILLG